MCVYHGIIAVFANQRVKIRVSVTFDGLFFDQKIIYIKVGKITN